MGGGSHLRQTCYRYFYDFLSVFILFDGEPFFTKDPDLDADNNFSCIFYVPHGIIFFSVTLIFTNH